MSNFSAAISEHTFSLPLIFPYMFHVKPRFKKKLYRGHLFFTNFAKHVAHKSKDWKVK